VVPSPFPRRQPRNVPPPAPRDAAVPSGFQEQPPEPAAIDQLRSIASETPAPTAETTEAVVEDLVTDAPEMEIPLNARVLSYVELFSGRLKTYLQDGLKRGAQYLPMIHAVFQEEGLPGELAYVPLIESAFKPNAVSSASAKGMWQFMRGTALENGLKHDWYIDERADPEKATRAAARYLKTLYGMFGDWPLALASYNGGPGRVQRAMKSSGRTDFWALSSTSRFLPRETRDYVPLIMAAVIVARNPAQYGLEEVESSAAPLIERVALSEPLDLRRVADWLGVPLTELQQLNPELRRWTTPLRAAEYELKVPEGGAEVVRARLAEADPALLTPVARHTVKKGDTLNSVAKRLKVTRADLAAANYLSTSAKLRAGQQLVIPKPPALVPLSVPAAPVAPETQLAATTGLDTPAGVDTLPAAASDPEPATVNASTRPVAKTAPVKRNAEVTVVHRVKSGETLTSIARRYGTSVASLKQWNRLRGSTILAGQRLTVVSRRQMATN
jgi:membrane-bound lytic murein transglycosylase D